MPATVERRSTVKGRSLQTVDKLSLDQQLWLSFMDGICCIHEYTFDCNFYDKICTKDKPEDMVATDSESESDGEYGFDGSVFGNSVIASDSRIALSKNKKEMFSNENTVDEADSSYSKFIIEESTEFVEPDTRLDVVREMDTTEVEKQGEVDSSYAKFIIEEYHDVYEQDIGLNTTVTETDAVTTDTSLSTEHVSKDSTNESEECHEVDEADIGLNALETEMNGLDQEKSSNNEEASTDSKSEVEVYFDTDQPDIGIRALVNEIVKETNDIASVASETGKSIRIYNLGTGSYTEPASKLTSRYSSPDRFDDKIKLTSSSLSEDESVLSLPTAQDSEPATEDENTESQSTGIEAEANKPKSAKIETIVEPIETESETVTKEDESAQSEQSSDHEESEGGAESSLASSSLDLKTNQYRGKPYKEYSSKRKQQIMKKKSILKNNDEESQLDVCNSKRKTQGEVIMDFFAYNICMNMFDWIGRRTDFRLSCHGGYDEAGTTATYGTFGTFLTSPGMTVFVDTVFDPFGFRGPKEEK